MQRRHDLDWVRVCAFGVLVLYHVGMYYVSWDWHVKSPHAGIAPEPWMLLSGPWRLSLLFLVSGAATAFLLARGPTGFLRRRSWRLLPPLIFGMFVVVPPQTYFEVAEKFGNPASYFEFYKSYLTSSPCQGAGCPVTPTWNHLWFVAYLWAYTAALCLLRLVPAVLDAGGRWLSAALSGPGVLLWPALYLAVARVSLIDAFEPSHALIDDWYNHAQYFAVFLVGFLVARAEAVWSAMRHQRWPALALWFASWLGIVAYIGYYVEVAPPAWLRLCFRAAWGLNQWCAIVAVLGFAARLRDADHPALRYVTPAVFPVYILHQTILVALTRALAPLGLRPALEAPLLALLTLGLCFAGYEAIRRVPPLRPLFGLGPRARAAALGAGLQARA